MTVEARVFAEGSLRWAVASGTGVAWVTASGGATGLVGYLDAGATFTRTENKVLIKNRGVPDHWKHIGHEAGMLKFKFLQANTAQYPPTSTTAPGASLPMVHFELKHAIPELGGPTAQYHQFINCVPMPTVLSEAEQGNAYDQTWSCIAVIGPSITGYLATGSI